MTSLTCRLGFRGGLTACLAAVALAGIPANTAAETPAGRVEFNRDIRPILSDKCFACHGPDANRRKAGLRLDTDEGAKADRDGARVIVPGLPEESELIARITSPQKSRRMPPAKTGKSLSAEEIARIRRWIEQGAPYQAHWSFTAPQRPAIPGGKTGDWSRNPIDAFVLTRLQAAGLQPSPEADRYTLVRRLCFDLSGLPPTPQDADEFVFDPRPDAYERLVDLLLASPHFGERLAVWWLDLVRYADTVGYHGDQEHHAAPYRDYVIKAFNDNLPFDRFTTEQLAGDLLPGATTLQRIATCYNRLLQTTHEGGAQDKEYLAKYAADRVRNLSVVWMGATVGCAECHDHKYDPYTQQDFYRLAAFFADVQERGAYRGPDASPTKRPPEIEVPYPLDPGRKGLTMVTVSVPPRTMRLLRRGDWMDEGGEVVGPGVPVFLKPLDDAGPRPTRLDLARWLTSPDHPQTARVVVNRLWSLFLGAGLCRSLDDTGSQGEWPSHAELLDYLAVEFAEGGWDVKRLVRSIVLSSAYRQGSVPVPAPHQGDPDNRLFARQGRFRLPAEMIRDNALAVSGLLVRRLGGPSVRPYQPVGYYAHLNFPKRTYQADTGAGQYRRGLYTHWQRQYLHPMLRAFDAPSREECTAQRPASNTPLQALALLNDPTFVEAARVFAARIVREGGTADTERVRWAWRAMLTRPPADREAAALVGLYRESRRRYDADRAAARELVRVGLTPPPPDVDAVELAAWTAVGRALLNLNETITRN
jgi:mono/diheme cytochrome c family protein